MGATHLVWIWLNTACSFSESSLLCANAMCVTYTLQPFNNLCPLGNVCLGGGELWRPCSPFAQARHIAGLIIIISLFCLLPDQKKNIKKNKQPFIYTVKWMVSQTLLSKLTYTTNTSTCSILLKDVLPVMTTTIQSSLLDWLIVPSFNEIIYKQTFFLTKWILSCIHGTFHKAI